VTLVLFDITFAFVWMVQWYSTDECDIANNVLDYSMCYMQYVDEVLVQSCSVWWIWIYTHIYVSVIFTFLI
jgi:hypothetical protein